MLWVMIGPLIGGERTHIPKIETTAGVLWFNWDRLWLAGGRVAMGTSIDRRGGKLSGEQNYLEHRARSKRLFCLCLPTQQVMHGGFGSQALIEHPVGLFGDRHLDAEALR